MRMRVWAVKMNPRHNMATEIIVVILHSFELYEAFYSKFLNIKHYAMIIYNTLLGENHKTYIKKKNLIYAFIMFKV